MSNFVHYSESEPVISDDDRIVDFSAGSFEGSAETSIWLHVRGFHGGGALLSVDEARDFTRQLLAATDDLCAIDGGAR
jgi:hypothetical protein